MGEVVDLQAARARRQPEPWISKREAAEHLGVTPRTIDRWRAEKGLPCQKRYPTSPTRFKRSELDAWYRGDAA